MSRIDWDRRCECSGLLGDHEYGCPGCKEGSDGHDRSQPRYRLFDLSSEDDGRPMVWYYVIANSFVCGEVEPEIADELFSLVENSTWREGFWRAFTRNMKATIYAPMIPTTSNIRNSALHVSSHTA